MPSHDAQHTRPVWAEISADHLRGNYARLRNAAGKDVDVLAVVKANAYGHGATECAPILAAAGARWLGVTSVEEGIAVRRSLGILPQGILPRILVMCGVWVGEAEACLQNGLTPVVWERYHLDLLQRAAQRLGFITSSVDVHLEIDTGMARQGVAPGPALAGFLESFSGATALRLEGILTHFASAECVDDPQNAFQAELFRQALQQVAHAGFAPSILHAGNTSGLDSGFCVPHLQAWAARYGARPMARAGLALYGHALPLKAAASSAPTPELELLQPVLTWKTRVVSLRDIPSGATVGYDAAYLADKPMRLALLPVGYADGFRRALSSATQHPGGAVLVYGRRVPILGRISMDLSMIYVSDLDGVAIGDEVTLLGRQGDQCISATEHAALAHTSVYEILCGINDRVPRVVIG